MEKTDLKSLDKQGLKDFCAEQGMQSYRADQIFQWLYQKSAVSVDQMTNLSKDLREKLGGISVINAISIKDRRESRDGTIKFLFECADARLIEGVLIPDFGDDGQANRLTVCVSSQVGCIFGCSFCATGKMGFFRSLTCGEIADQAILMNQVAEERYGRRITNIVYMGMGEPLHNYEAVVKSGHILADEMSLNMAPRRLTISTVGLTKMIRRLGDEKQPFRLAVSLHAANDEKRNEIMPINQSLDLNELESALRHYHDMTGQPVTYEYLLFQRFNDHAEDAARLAKIARWIPSKVNIIMYNNVAGVELQRAAEERLDAFLSALKQKDVLATVRRSRGDDIDAGCGQLAIREGAKRGKTIAKTPV